MDFQITISTLSQKKTSQLIDALRILAWSEFKTKYKDQASNYKTVLDFYKEVFDPLWKKSALVSMNLDEVTKYIDSLGYTVEDVLSMRSKHYQDKADAKLRFENKNKPQVEATDF
jgi:predicted nucleotidyltransferase